MGVQEIVINDDDQSYQPQEQPPSQFAEIFTSLVSQIAVLVSWQNSLIVCCVRCYVRVIACCSPYCCSTGHRVRWCCALHPTIPKDSPNQKCRRVFNACRLLASLRIHPSGLLLVFPLTTKHQQIHMPAVYACYLNACSPPSTLTTATRFGHPFETPLLLQSFIMIGALLLVQHACVNCDPGPIPTVPVHFSSTLEAVAEFNNYCCAVNNYCCGVAHLETAVTASAMLQLKPSRWIRSGSGHPLEITSKLLAGLSSSSAP
jgi:hypothetical protein